MANTIITPSIIAREALATLYANTVFAQLVYRDFDPDFAGKVGDTITVRKPAVFTANTFNRATGIVLQDMTEGSLTVTLDTLLDVSFTVTAEDLVLRVFDFAEQFIQPAAMAIAQKIDQLIAAVATGAGVTNSTNLNTAVGGIAVPTQLVRAKQALDTRNVPTANRVAVLSTAQGADLLTDPLFLQAQQRGDTQGLTDATIGHKFGFDNYVSNNLPGTAGVAFVPEAFALVTRTLLPPSGIPADAVAVQQMDGFGIRVVRGYDITKKQDIVSLDVLIGTKVIDPARAQKLTMQ